MLVYNPKEPVISIHIPKCGGISLKSVLEHWFGDKLYFHYYHHKRGEYPPKIKIKNFITGKLKSGICIHGHFENTADVGAKEYYPEIKQYFTFVREPLEMQISTFWYEYNLSQKGKLYVNGNKITLNYDIDEYLETSKPYSHVFFPEEMNAENYESMLNKYYIHIGLLENYQISLNILAEKLNRPKIDLYKLNNSDRIRKPSETSVRKFKEKCLLEYKVFEYACGLNK